MRTRAAAALALASVGLGVAAVVFASIAYVNTAEARANAPVAGVLSFWDGTVPDPTLPGYPALPDADHLPAVYTAQERKDATIWLQQKQYVDQCMADAGYEQWRYAAKWQTGVPSDFHRLWVEGLSGPDLQRAYDAHLGTPDEPQRGVDYTWEENGCEGYGWHMVGIDYPIF